MMDLNNATDGLEWPPLQCDVCEKILESPFERTDGMCKPCYEKKYGPSNQKTVLCADCKTPASIWQLCATDVCRDCLLRLVHECNAANIASASELAVALSGEKEVNIPSEVHEYVAQNLAVLVNLAKSRTQYWNDPEELNELREEDASQPEELD